MGPHGSWLLSRWLTIQVDTSLPAGHSPTLTPCPWSPSGIERCHHPSTWWTLCSASLPCVRPHTWTEAALLDIAVWELHGVRHLNFPRTCNSLYSSCYRTHGGTGPGPVVAWPRSHMFTPVLGAFLTCCISTPTHQWWGMSSWAQTVIRTHMYWLLFGIYHDIFRMRLIYSSLDCYPDSTHAIHRCDVTPTRK